MSIEPSRRFRFYVETSRLEWATVILAVVIGAFLTLTFWWQQLPPVLVILATSFAPA